MASNRLPISEDLLAEPPPGHLGIPAGQKLKDKLDIPQQNFLPRCKVGGQPAIRLHRCSHFRRESTHQLLNGSYKER